MRPKIFAANWKMNKTSAEAEAFLQTWINLPEIEGDHKVLFFAPATNLYVFKGLKGTLRAEFGEQNMYPKESGAFTGEISCQMLQDVGCQYVIIGHSERRHVIGETDVLINAKLKAVVASGLKPILCIGEKLDQRDADQPETGAEQQLAGGLAGLTSQQLSDLVIAYEPVWAIGTGRTATPDQAQEVHVFVRARLTDMFGEAFARGVRIQYGGSVKPGNAADLANIDQVQGFLIGGASLDAKSFRQIIERYAAQKQNPFESEKRH